LHLADKLEGIAGVEVVTPAFFNEFAIRLPAPAEQIVEALAEKSVLGGVPVSRLMPDSNMDDVLLVAATEANTEADLEIYEAALRDVLKGVSA
jgi:glycine dehydrogenase subunit 1